MDPGVALRPERKQQRQMGSIGQAGASQELELLALYSRASMPNAKFGVTW